MSKPLLIAEDIVPIGQFKAHASEVVRAIRSRGRPVVITQNGKAAAVLLSPRDFDRLTYQAQFLEAVREGLADAKAGRVIADDELGRELSRRLRPTDE